MAKDNDLDIRRENRFLHPFNTLFPEFEHLAERFFGRDFAAGLPMITRAPKMDIKENSDAFMITAELPGIPKDEIDVNVSGNVLTIKGQEEESKDERHRQYRSYYQSFTLPSNVDSEKLEAHHENGVLELWVPKTQSSRPRKIELQSGKGGFKDRMNEKDAQSKSTGREKENAKSTGSSAPH